MAKRSKSERAASAGARVAGRGVGAALSSPFGIAGLGIAAVIILLVIFRKDIGKFFEGLKFPEINLPDINFPDIKFPEFPEIKFPDFDFPEFPEIKFPDFTSLFEGFQNQLDELFKNQQSILAGQTVTNEFGQDVDIPADTVINDDGTVSSSTPPVIINGGATQQEQDFAVARAGAFDTLFDLNIQGLSGQQLQQAISAIEFGDFAALDALIISLQSLASDQQGLTPAQQFAQSKGGFDVPFNDPTELGGGLSFIGGTTTFGSGIVDTLSEVLAIFPNLTSSQAANALFANPDLTKNEFAQITPFQPSISSAGGDPEQIINNASGGFSGLTPQQIAFILTGGNISNF